MKRYIMLKFIMIFDVDKKKKNFFLYNKVCIILCFIGNFFKEGLRDDFGC